MKPPGLVEHAAEQIGARILDTRPPLGEDASQHGCRDDIGRVLGSHQTRGKARELLSVLSVQLGVGQSHHLLRCRRSLLRVTLVADSLQRCPNTAVLLVIPWSIPFGNLCVSAVSIGVTPRGSGRASRAFWISAGCGDHSAGVPRARSQRSTRSTPTSLAPVGPLSRTSSRVRWPRAEALHLRTVARPGRGKVAGRVLRADRGNGSGGLLRRRRSSCPGEAAPVGSPWPPTEPCTSPSLGTTGCARCWPAGSSSPPPALVARSPMRPSRSTGCRVARLRPRGHLRRFVHECSRVLLARPNASRPPVGGVAAESA